MQFHNGLYWTSCALLQATNWYCCKFWFIAIEQDTTFAYSIVRLKLQVNIATFQSKTRWIRLSKLQVWDILEPQLGCRMISNHIKFFQFLVAICEVLAKAGRWRCCATLGATCVKAQHVAPPSKTYLTTFGPKKKQTNVWITWWPSFMQTTNILLNFFTPDNSRINQLIW